MITPQNLFDEFLGADWGGEPQEGALFVLSWQVDVETGSIEAGLGGVAGVAGVAGKDAAEAGLGV